jgi:Tfp pilus assembly PilM family ATPase
MIGRNDIYILEPTNLGVKIVRVRKQHPHPRVVDIRLEQIPAGLDGYQGLAPGQIFPARETRPGRVYVILPRRSFFMKQLSLPSEDPAEITRMIELQMGQFTPYPREDVVIHYSLLGPDPSGMTKALVEVVPKSTLIPYLDVVHSAGVKTCDFILSSWMLLGRLPTEMVEKMVSNPFVVIDVDEDSSEICFYQSMKLLFSRSCDSGARDLKSGNVDEFSTQLSLTLAAYNREFIGGGIQKKFLVGEALIVEKLQKILEAVLTVPVEAVPPAALTGLTAQEDPSQTFLQKYPLVSLSSISGLMSAIAQNQIPVLPLEGLSKGPRGNSRKIIWSITLILLIAMVGYALAGARLSKKEHYLSALEAELSLMKDQATLDEEKMRGTQTFINQIQASPFIPEVLAQVFKDTPDGITFAAIRLGEDRQMTLEGFANPGNLVRDFQNQLMRNSFFTDVVLQHSTRQNFLEKEYTAFTISCRLSGL